MKCTNGREGKGNQVQGLNHPAPPCPTLPHPLHGRGSTYKIHPAESGSGHPSSAKGVWVGVGGVGGGDVSG
ncbi:hypothetical protein JZ751_023863 [Albula glossodonta]|uniref:Uncharacterized protein n=1 Tax=Albula glossodonta TaxID=121402 RepID=A0A8T2NP18_9TELE|nr:hypothetical protein JZ751_023863 [Albula glossodonta]